MLEKFSVQIEIVSGMTGRIPHLMTGSMTGARSGALMAMLAVSLVTCGRLQALAFGGLPAAPSYRPRDGSATLTTSVVHGIWTMFKLPAGAEDLALKSSGAWASASTTAKGFDPNGTIDGNWTAQNWGKGHGWQNATRHQYPSWLQVRFPHQQQIDTIVIQTFPEVMRGVNWQGIRNIDVEVEVGGKWQTVGWPTTLRGNTRGTIVIPLPELRTAAIRITVLGVNTGNQDDTFYDDDDFARILQVGVFRLKVPYPFVSEALTVRVERGALGSIAIYRDELPVKPANPSSPEYLASVFRKAGYGVTFLDSKALCIPEIFNHKNFDVFIQPYGALFPVETTLFEFLHQGGHLITMGGHPFRRALMFSPQAELVDGGYDPGITTSVSRQSDYRLTFRQQLGMFYNGYERLEDVAYAAPAPSQEVANRRFKVSGRLEGEVASALLGERLSLEDGQWLTRHGGFPSEVNNARQGLSNLTAVLNSEPNGASFDYLSGYIFNWPRSRWIPLVNAYDRLGQLRGSVVSMMTNFRGPYRGSAWIFSGVENEDLFSPQHPEFAHVLLDALAYLRPSLGVHSIEPEMDCYRQGEMAKASAVIENYSSERRRVAVDFQFIPRGSKLPAFEKQVSLALEPQATARPSVTWSPGRFDADFYRIQVSLLADGREVRSGESAFVVWDPRILAQGPKVDFHDSYFHAGDRPELLMGARYNGVQPHGQVDEDALAWDRQFAEMYDSGMRVVSPVFFSVYVPGLAWGKPQTPAIPPQLQRLLDAQVQLAQRHHLIFAPCIFFIAKYMAMEQPEFSRRICEELGRRYASVPGIMFYIFDDGTPNTPLQEFREWTRKCIEGFSSSGRKYVVMAEIGGVVMQRYGSDALSFPSDGTYQPGLPSFFRMMDERASGKSFQLSEFGVNSPGATPSDVDLHTYPGLNVSGSPTGDYSVYLMEPHLLFATGGAYVVNWVWKDPAHLIFPWGVTNPNDYTPKKPLYAYRNDSYFLRHFEPAFHFPRVLVIFSKEHLVRGENSFAPYLSGVVNALFDADVQFAVIDDDDLDRIPAGPHVLIYPDPRYASARVFEKLRSRVEAGDELFITGDFTQPVDQNGRRETDLLNKFAGLRWMSDYPAGTALAITPAAGVPYLTSYIGSPQLKLRPDGATVLGTDTEGDAVIATYRVGSGNIFYTADTGTDGTRRALRAFIGMRSVPEVAISPRLRDRPIFELDRVHGGKVYTLFAIRPEGTSPNITVNGPWIETPETYVVETGTHKVQIPLGAYGVSLFAVRGDGSLDGLEGQGRFNVDGAALFESEPHAMVMSLDQESLTKSHALALFTIGSGKISLAAAHGVDTVEMGEIVEGHFRPVEQVRTAYRNGKLVFHIDEALARGVLLITSNSNKEHARALMSAALQQ